MMLFPEIAKTKPEHDPGGKVRLKLKDGTTGTAHFGGRDKEYRYALTRSWDAKKPQALFVLMNPSTADPSCDDPTVAKCCRFAKNWGYGGIVVANTFAYRCTDQGRLIKVADPVGVDNDAYIIKMAKKAAIVIFAYGKPSISNCADVAQLSLASSSTKLRSRRMS